MNFYSSNYTAAHGLQFSDTRSVSTYITAYKFVHETEELCPDDPATRRDIGAGEVVNLSIQPGPTSTTWKLSGDTNVGEIQDTSSSENQFSAFQTAGTAIITATTSDRAEFSVSLKVWTPQGLVFEGDSTKGLQGSVPGINFGWQYYVSFSAFVYVYPDFVNFNNLILQEGGCNTVTTGFATNKTWLNHTADGPWYPAGVCPIPGEGTLLANEDGIAQDTQSQPYVPNWGSTVWPIPWFWTIGGSWPEVEFPDLVDEEGVMTTTSGVTTWTVSKNHQVTAAISDTSGGPYWVQMQ